MLLHTSPQYSAEADFGPDSFGFIRRRFWNELLRFFVQGVRISVPLDSRGR